MDESPVYALTLDMFLKVIEENRGVSLDEIGAGETLVIETQDSTYTIHILDPDKGQVVVGGDKYFPIPEVCVLAGSTWGGSMLRTKWVGLKMRLEFQKHDGQRIVTSFVKSISLVCPEPVSHKAN